MPHAPQLADIRLYPIKSLDGVSVQQARIGIGGGLDLDRAWALFTADGRCLNGKRSAMIHQIRAAFTPDIRAVTLSAPGNHRNLAPKEFGFPRGGAEAAQWFSTFFDQPVVVRHAPDGFPDDLDRNGPLVVSTESLRTVANWFEGLDLAESRRRFRAPLEIGGVSAFWEDRLFNEDEDPGVRFLVGDVALEGTNPCPRCLVPTRGSLDGSEWAGFQKRFSELRRAQFPSWACAPRRITHFYHLGINTRVASTEYGKLLRVGDPVTVATPRPG